MRNLEVEMVFVIISLISFKNFYMVERRKGGKNREISKYYIGFLIFVFKLFRENIMLLDEMYSDFGSW